MEPLGGRDERIIVGGMMKTERLKIEEEEIKGKEVEIKMKLDQWEK